MADHSENFWPFLRFSETVRGRYRYVHSPGVQEFLRTLVETAESRVKTLPRDFVLWRAQLGYDIKNRKIDDPEIEILVEDQVPFCAERMKPRKNAAHEGRVNPKGIPCLYLATDQRTAMSEVRPWIGAAISLGEFHAARELKLVDMSVDASFQLTADHYFGLVNRAELIKGNWAQVGKAFSTPVVDDPSTAEYIPTQIIAESFRRAGFDGISYNSALADGSNIALFDLDAASLVDCRLQQATKVIFEFGELR